MSTVKEEVRAGRPGTGQEAQRTDAIRHKSGGRRSTSLTAGGEGGNGGALAWMGHWRQTSGTLGR